MPPARRPNFRPVPAQNFRRPVPVAETATVKATASAYRTNYIGTGEYDRVSCSTPHFPSRWPLPTD